MPSPRGQLTDRAEAGAIITIEPWPRRPDDDPETPAQCRVSWSGTDWSRIVTVDQVSAMSDAFQRAAGQAELMRSMLRMGFDGETVQRMTEAVIREIGQEQGDDVLLAVPAAQVRLKTAVVVVRAVGTEIQGAVDPSETRKLATRWMQAAELSIYDELLHEALGDVLGVDVQRRNQVMAYMRMLHGTRHEPEGIRQLQVAELRAEFGYPSA